MLTVLVMLDEERVMYRARRLVGCEMTLYKERGCVAHVPRCGGTRARGMDGYEAMVLAPTGVTGTSCFSSKTYKLLVNRPSRYGDTSTDALP